MNTEARNHIYHAALIQEDAEKQQAAYRLTMGKGGDQKTARIDSMAVEQIRLWLAEERCVTPTDRIRCCAQAVATVLGGNHLRYMSIVAVVLYADESVNNLEEWDFVLDADAKAAAVEGAAEIVARQANRNNHKRKVANVR